MPNYIVSKTWKPQRRVVFGNRTTPETVYRIFADRDEALAEYRELTASDRAKSYHFRGEPRWMFATTGRPATTGWVNTKAEANKAKRRAAAARARALK